jgi:hypothetical protein
MGTLQPGQYGVIAPSTIIGSLPPGTLTLDLGNAHEFIQNGAPDGIALIDGAHPRVLDALSYEGAITAAQIVGFPGPVSLVEGTVLSALTADSNSQNGSLSRLPNGQDANNAATDWSFTPTLTPGSANVP